MSRDLNVKHLEYFLKVAQLGSINKAAQALFISQPYLGKIIHDLEDGFGYLLLNRGNHGVTLTPEGEEFVKRANHVLEEIGCLWHTSERKEDYRHLSVSMTKFSHVMESFIEVVMRHQDQRAFTHRLYEGSPDQVLDDVFSGRAAVGVFHFDRKRRREVEDLLTAKKLVYRHLAYAEPHIVLSKKPSPSPTGAAHHSAGPVLLWGHPLLGPVRRPALHPVRLRGPGRPVGEPDHLPVQPGVPDAPDLRQ